ncbi:AsmA family protein [Rubripirellula reticaptiva]|nr:hypothetical protein [Rubripirellula reticaptiva]
MDSRDLGDWMLSWVRASPPEGKEDLAGNKDAAKPHSSGRLSRWLLAALIFAAAGFAIWSLAPQTIGETARRQLLCQLQAHYPNHHVAIRRGHFDPKVGLVVEDLRISEPTSMLGIGGRDLVRVERLTVVGDLHAEKLLDQQSPLVTRRVIVEGVTANVWMQDDGKPSLASLLPLPKLGPAAPRIDLRQVHVRMFGDALVDRSVDAEFTSITILNDEKLDGTINMDVEIIGTADFAGSIHAKVVKKEGSLDVRCSANNLHFNRRLYDALPLAWCNVLQHSKDLTCTSNASLSYHQTASGQINYRVEAKVLDGRIEHNVLPQPISQLRGAIVCDPQGISVSNAQAYLGDALLQIPKARLDGHRWPGAVDIELKTRGLLLDDRFASTLPVDLQQKWHKLQPVGRVDADATLEFRNGKWQTAADLTCHGVDVRYEKFPYPIEQVVGKLRLRNGIVETPGLSGRVSSNRMLCAFRLPIDPSITQEKSFIVQTDGPIPIDKTLLESLSPRASETSGLESFVRSLHPRGSMKLTMGVFATDANGHQSRSIELDVIDGHMRYDNFAYPLYNVAGKIHVQDQLVKLIGFRATNANAGVILCDGAYQMPSPKPLVAQYRISDTALSYKEDSQLQLNFTAQNVPMDESLRSSLPYSTQQVWDAISPSGVLDEVKLTLGKFGSAPVTLNMKASQWEHGQVTNRILSIRPPSLPYRLDVTGGVVQFDGSEVTIESLQASHDASKVSLNGRCVQGADGRWVLATNLHSGSRLRPDAELIAALPEQMREAMRRLQLRGPVSVRGTTELTIPDESRPEPTINWDLDLQLEGNRIADVGPVHSLRGEISVKGVRNESILRAEGEVRIDSMHVDDLQITGIRGPFSIDDDRMDLGGRAAGTTPNGTPSIRGKLFDGTIDLDGQVVLSTGDFDVGVAIKDAKLPTVLADFGHIDDGWTGTLSGQTKLQGNLGTSDLLKGNGAARVTGANLYQLPFIVKVMNLISVTPTEDVAFTDGEVEFTVFGDSLTFNQMHLWGALVSLEGGGTMNRRQELDLTFNTRVSPQNTFTKIVRPLRSQRYTLMTIDVTGPVSDVQIERRTLDGVGQTLGRLFPGMGKSEDEDDSSSASARSGGRWFQ